MESVKKVNKYTFTKIYICEKTRKRTFVCARCLNFSLKIACRGKGDDGFVILQGGGVRKISRFFAESFGFRLKIPNKYAIIIYCIIMFKRKG